MAQESGRLIFWTTEIEQAHEIMQGIIHLHAQCILVDGTLANFLPPLSETKFWGYWTKQIELVKESQMHLIVYLLPVAARTRQSPDPIFAADSNEPKPTPILSLDGQEYEVAGTVGLSIPPHETGPQRCGLEKLFVSPRHRQKGIARTMIRELERMARQLGRWSVILGTEVDSAAELVYRRLGFTQLAIIRQHGVSPVDGHLTDEISFHKDLRTSPEI